MRSSFLSLHSLLLLLSCGNIIFAAPAIRPGSDLSKRSGHGNGVEEHDQSFYDPTIVSRSTWAKGVNNIQKRTKKGKAKTGNTNLPAQEKLAAGAKNPKDKAAGGVKDPKKATAAAKDKSKVKSQQKPKKPARGGSGGPPNGFCPMKRSGPGKKQPKKQETGKSRSKTPVQGQSKQSKKQSGTKKQNGAKKPKGPRGLQVQKRADPEANIDMGGGSDSSSDCVPHDILWDDTLCLEIDMGEMGIQDLGTEKYIGTAGLNGCTAVVVKSNSAALVAHVAPGDETDDTAKIATQIRGSAAKFPTAQIRVLFYTPRETDQASQCTIEVEQMKRELPTVLGIQSSAITTEFYDEDDDLESVGTMLLVTPSGSIILGDSWDTVVDL